MEQCDRCEKMVSETRETIDGESICANCIKRESARYQSEKDEKIEVKRERGRWRKK